MTELAYKITGQGPDLVFLHGWGMHSEIWRPVLPLLENHFRLTLVDLPGHGRSRDISADAIDDVVNSLRAVVPAVAGWVGWSLGGQVAMRFGERFPERVDKLLLVASNPCFIQKTGWPNALDPELLQQFSDELQQDWQGTIRRFIALQFLGTAVSAQTLRHLQEQMISLPADSMALRRGLHWLQTVDFSQQVTALEMPVKFLLGRLDRLVPRQLEQTLSSIGIETQVMKGAGHAPFISHPDVFCSVVNEFFNPDIA